MASSDALLMTSHRSTPAESASEVVRVLFGFVALVSVFTWQLFVFAGSDVSARIGLDFQIWCNFVLLVDEVGGFK